MAKKNTQAERIVSETKKKSSAASANSKSSAKKGTKKQISNKKPPKVKTEYENPIPTSAVVSIMSFFLFILFLVISIQPEGALLLLIRSIVFGLFGQAGFYFSIPALLYIFFMNTFGRKKSVTMRGICTITFVIMCGVIYHLIVSSNLSAAGFDILPALYKGGISGNTGGIICGGLAILLRWGCGTALSFMITIIIAALTLLGAMQITLPSIIRAIINRPRDVWDEEEDYIEPAAVVINHIANKKIEQKRQKRAMEAKLQAVSAESMPEAELTPKQDVQKKAPPMLSGNKKNTDPVTALPETVHPESSLVEPKPSKGSAFMDSIDMDI